MKRTLSLVLALIMVLGTFTGVFAAEDFSAAEFLKDNGVLEGADGDLMLDKTLLRRDMVVLFSRLMKAEDVAEAFPSEDLTFEDITDSYYNGYLAWSVANKLIEGHDSLTFGFNENVTAQQYATVLLRALEYEGDEDIFSTSLETAEELEILEGVDVEETTEITRDEMAIMTFNALAVEMLKEGVTLAEFLNIDLPEDPKAKELTAEVNDTENLMEVVVELSNAELADELKLENASNYRLSGSRTVKSAEIVEDNVVLLLDNALVRNREYTLTIKGIDRAINGEYKFDARDNTVPTVESVEVLGEYGIKVTTSEPVEKPAERNILIDGKRVSMVVEQYGRDIILSPYHERSFDKDASELEIIELVDFAGYRSTSLREEIEIVKDETAPEIVKSTMSDNKVTVEFDKDIYEPSVKKYDSSRSLGNASYAERRITIYAEKATKIDTNKVVYEFDQDLPRNVELTIEGVQNHSKVTMEKTNISPVLVTSDDDAVIIDNDKRKTISVNRTVYGEDQLGKVHAGNLTLTIKFDEKVDVYEAEDIRNYTVYEKEVNSRGKRAAENDGIVVVSAVVQENGKDVKVTFKNLRINDKHKNYDYILEVNGLETAGGSRIFRDYVDFEVVRSGAEFEVVGDVVSVSANRNNVEIEIEFSHEVDLDSALDARNYIFTNAEYKKAKDLDELDGYVIVEEDGEIVTLVIPVTRGEEQDDFFNDYKNLEVLSRVTRLNGDRLDDSNRDFGIVDPRPAE